MPSGAQNTTAGDYFQLRCRSFNEKINAATELKPCGLVDLPTSTEQDPVIEYLKLKIDTKGRDVVLPWLLCFCLINNCQYFQLSYFFEQAPLAYKHLRCLRQNYIYNLRYFSHYTFPNVQLPIQIISVAFSVNASDLSHAEEGDEKNACFTFHAFVLLSKCRVHADREIRDYMHSNHVAKYLQALLQQRIWSHW